jgi:hypothetical protein
MLALGVAPAMASSAAAAAAAAAGAADGAWIAPADRHRGEAALLRGTSTTTSHEKHRGGGGGGGMVGVTRRRRDQDVEDLLNDMANRDPSEWTGLEWFVMILFLSFLGWAGCCLLALCCCGGGGWCCLGGRGRGGCGLSDLLCYGCLWEMCCRGGRDIDECCDYGLAL